MTLQFKVSLLGGKMGTTVSKIDEHNMDRARAERVQRGGDMKRKQEHTVYHKDIMCTSVLR